LRLFTPLRQKRLNFQWFCAIQREEYDSRTCVRKQPKLNFQISSLKRTTHNGLTYGSFNECFLSMYAA
jgi:hypothetical protein